MFYRHFLTLHTREVVVAREPGVREPQHGRLHAASRRRAASRDDGPLLGIVEEREAGTHDGDGFLE